MYKEIKCTIWINKVGLHMIPLSPSDLHSNDTRTRLKHIPKLQNIETTSFHLTHITNLRHTPWAHANSHSQHPPSAFYLATTRDFKVVHLHQISTAAWPKRPNQFNKIRTQRSRTLQRSSHALRPVATPGIKKEKCATSHWMVYHLRN